MDEGEAEDARARDTVAQGERAAVEEGWPLDADKARKNQGRG